MLSSASLLSCIAPALYRWCLCASRWKEALDAGAAPPVYLDGCHEKALKYVSMEQLQQYALTGADAFEGGSEEEAAARDRVKQEL